MEIKILSSKDNTMIPNQSVLLRWELDQQDLQVRLV